MLIHIGMRKHTSLLLRKHVLKNKFYPKTTIPIPVPGKCPSGPSTMAGLFKWPDVFLALLSHHFGERYVKKRLNAWNWDVATSFSGVGCPENVPLSFIIGCYWMFCFAWGPTPKNKPFQVVDLWTLPKHWLKAITCLQRSCSKFVNKKDKEFVRFKWAFEWNKSCQRVLSETYRVCCFDDINKYNGSKSLMCSTHGKMCSPCFKVGKSGISDHLKNWNNCSQT